MTTKTADSKGRIALGKEFAGVPVIIEHINQFEIRVRKARVIPESEAWLWENQDALRTVKQGLKQAQAMDFAIGPDLNADDDLVGELAD